MIMRSLFILCITLALLLGAEKLSAASKFIPGINDLPLMPGLVLKSETPVVFDTPGGRIVEVFAFGNIPSTRIRSFYGDTLPQLGWQPSGRNEFQRDKERLKIEISDENSGGRVVRFSVVPVNQWQGPN